MGWGEEWKIKNGGRGAWAVHRFEKWGELGKEE